MKVSNMTSSRGNAVPNQFIISDCVTDHSDWRGQMFQSYDSAIAFRSYRNNAGFDGTLYLDERYWDYSVTTSKYRNQFTGLTTAQTKAGINDGSIKLVDLN